MSCMQPPILYVSGYACNTHAGCASQALLSSVMLDGFFKAMTQATITGSGEVAIRSGRQLQSFWNSGFV